MRVNVFTKIALIIFIVLFSAGAAMAQAGRGIGRISGVVVDKEGKPVPSAKIVAAFQQDSNANLETTANKKGEWSIIGVGTGSWVITASAQGYHPASINFYVRQLDKNPKMTIKLEKMEKPTGVIQDEAAFEFLEQGNQFFKDGKYDTAIIMYQQFLEKNPAAYQILLNIGDCYREKGEFDKALEIYNSVIEKAKTDETMGINMTAKALAGIGVCYLKQNNLEEAQKFFKQSIDTSPQDETIAYDVAEIYFSNQQIDEALRYFELAAQLKPDWPDPYFKLGYVYLNKGDMGKAVEYFEKFIKLEPETERSAQAKNIINTIKK